MATQEIPNSGGDYIDNVVNDSWQKGVCPPEWQGVHTAEFTEEYT